MGRGGRAVLTCGLGGVKRGCGLLGKTGASWKARAQHRPSHWSDKLTNNAVAVCAIAVKAQTRRNEHRSRGTASAQSDTALVTGSRESRSSAVRFEPTLVSPGPARESTRSGLHSRRWGTIPRRCITPTRRTRKSRCHRWTIGKSNGRRIRREWRSRRWWQWISIRSRPVC